MENYDILVSYYCGIRLEYRITPDGITVSGRTPDGRRENATVILHKCEEKRRKLCGLMWAARATPKTAQELAEDIEV